MALAVKRGELSRSDVSKEVTKIADKMSEKDIKKFAKTKHADLPVKVQEILSYIYEANAVSGGKIHKFITGKNLTFKGKKYANLEFEVLRVDNNSKLVTLRILSPKELFGKELNVPFKTIRRGPFLKTDTSKLEQVDNLPSMVESTEKNRRIPRKKGQHRNSSSHSDLYTDENPKGTIKGLKFATVDDAKKSVNKIKRSGRSHAHKIQAAIAMEQRARVMGKTSQAAVYRAYINKMKRKTKEKNEGWSDEYKRSIDCNNPKGFSQKAHCAGKKKRKENVAPNHDGKSSPYGSGYKKYKKKNEIYFDRFGNKCKNPTTLDGRCIDKYHPSPTIREPLSEIPMADLEKIDAFADKKLSPKDVVLTGKHFFDRLNDKRNQKEISNAELIGFFKRLSRKKKEFLEFLNKYKQVVATDNRTNINIPFMVQANRIIAKTIMRKKGFTTTNKTIQV